MSLKMKYHSKLNVNQNRISLKMECHLKWNVTQIKMSLNWESYSNCNATKIGMSLKIYSFEMQHNLKWNVTQTGMSLKMECQSNLMSLKLEDLIDWKGCKSKDLTKCIFRSICNLVNRRVKEDEHWYKQNFHLHRLVLNKKTTYFSVCYPNFLKLGDNEIERLGPSEKWAFY